MLYMYKILRLKSSKTKIDTEIGPNDFVKGKI